jgi:hypothetical protein
MDRAQVAKMAPMVFNYNFILMGGPGYMDGLGLLFSYGLALANKGKTRRNRITILFCFVSIPEGHGMAS